MTIKQTQKSGSNSSNIATTGDVIINQGIDEKRAREITDELLRDRFEKFTAEARIEAERRRQRFEDEVIGKLQATGTPLDQFADPRVQIAYREAVLRDTEYDNNDTREITIDLLSEVIAAEAATPKSIIYTDAMKIAPRITKRQVDFLTFIFLLSRTKCNFNNTYSFNTYEDLINISSVLNDRFNMFIDLNTNSMDIMTLSALNCVTQPPFTSLNIYKHIEQYKKLIPRLLSNKDVENLAKIGFNSTDTMAVGSKYVMNNAGRVKLLEASPLNSDDFGQLEQHLKAEASDAEIKEFVDELNLFEKTRTLEKALEKFNLIVSPIGMALAICNARKRGIPLDESIWFPEPS